MNITRTLATLLVLLAVVPVIAQSEIPLNFAPTNDGFDHVRRTVEIPMRDGVKLHTVILIPKGARHAPMLLTRTPYDADSL
ncbi:MAG: CocE/NonD family hydrolase, partial [Thermoanaerobaculia bacterium]